MASTAPTEMPVAAAEPAISEPLYFNRELSWLAFNRRVLEESCNANYPLLERLRFLSISASNLDEFFMVRVAGLKAHQALGVEEHSADGLTPGQQLAAIETEADRLLDDQEEVWRTLQAALAKSKVVVLLTDGENNIDLITPLAAADLAAQEKVKVYTVFAGRYVYTWNGGNMPQALTNEFAEEIAGGRMRAPVPLPAMESSFEEDVARVAT